MTASMSPELYWTILTAGMTSIQWAPHIAQRIIEMKPYAAFRDPRHDVPTKAAWAQRAIRAHTNTTENLVVFAILALAIQATGVGTTLTAGASVLFFAARAAHYTVYVLGIPWMRTPIFLVGFGCQAILFVTLVG